MNLKVAAVIDSKVNSRIIVKMIKMQWTLLLAVTIVISSCSSDITLRQKADELAHKYIITDGHVDIPYRLEEYMEDVSVRTERGDFDYVRAKEGGLDAPFMSIYVPSSYQETGGAKAKADSLIDLVENLANDHPDKFALAASSEEVEKIVAD